MQTPTPTCRFCGTMLRQTFVDLGMAPQANDYLEQKDLQKIQPYYPLRAFVCEKCFLVQLQDCETPENLFTYYPYFASYSDTMLEHSRHYVDEMIERFGFDSHSQIVEIGSNDGYLLQYFNAKGIPVLGIDPARNVAEAATFKGIPTLVKFFGMGTAAELVVEGKRADLLLGNNVLAHTPHLNDFVRGMKLLLKREGVITMEFPHLLRLMENNEFDTIYHEHYSYFSFTAVHKVFAEHGLTMFDVEQLPVHGGSLRIYARHEEDESRPVGTRVTELLGSEAAEGVTRVETYTSFAERVKQTKHKVWEFLVEAKNKNQTIAGYGAPAKGNTLLNYCGVRSDMIEYTVDRSPHKQGRYLPGTYIPIYHPDKIMETRPDYLLILPWNLKDEIMEQMSGIREWGGQFVVLIPDVEVIQ
ncbi:MAG: class I SAM-dependent methyltransferase [bacterium]|nr:class I SAM-dependent methyltransferase [bacterium]